MSTVAAPSDRRFRRAHVKPARRRSRWTARAYPFVRYAAIALAVLYGGYRLATIASHARVLSIDRIVVRGNERLSQGEVLALLTGLRGESLLGIDLDQWRDRLLASPWVREAALRRELPSTVEVVVTERRPIGIARVAGDAYLVDERGTIVDAYGPEYADLDLPIIDGLAAAPHRDDAAGGPVDTARAELAGRVVAALRSNADVARRLSQVDVRDVHNAHVILSGDPAVIALGEDQFLARLENYLELAPALHDRVAAIDYVDVRFDNRIYVRPVRAASKGSRAPAGDTAGRAGGVKR
jgi:cell division protein FtsQ